MDKEVVSLVFIATTCVSTRNLWRDAVITILETYSSD